MARVSTKVYASKDSEFWTRLGPQNVSTEQVKFSVGLKGSDEKLTLTANSPVVSFGVEYETVKEGDREFERPIEGTGDIQLATRAFGSVTQLLAEVEDGMNAWLLTQAKNAEKQSGVAFEQQIVDSTNAAIAKFTADRGEKPTAEQITKIRAKVREKLETLERMKKEETDLADI